MLKARFPQRFVAGMLSVLLAGSTLPAAATQASPAAAAQLQGNVFGQDGLTILTGVTVKAAHLETSAVYTSQMTGSDGVYTLAALPPGSYDLAVETPEGLFAADTVIELKAGNQKTISFAVRPSIRQEDPPSPDPNAPSAPADPNAGADPNAPAAPPAEPEPQPAPAKKKSFWRSNGGAAAAIVGGAVLLGFAASSAAGDDEEDDEPLTQSGN